MILILVFFRNFGQFVREIRVIHCLITMVFSFEFKINYYFSRHMRPQIVKRIILIVFCFFAKAMVLAQTGGSGEGPPNPGGQRGPELPIDENLIILLVVGILYGSYIAYKRQRLKNTQR